MLRLQTNDMEVYCLLEGCILADPLGRFAELKALAQERLRGYEPPVGTVRETAHWLASARGKIAAALEAGDLFRTAYLISVTSWKILEGIWLCNRKPTPAAGGLWAHYGDLADPPPRAWVRTLFVGEGRARADAALQRIAWILPRLTPDGPGS